MHRPISSAVRPIRPSEEQAEARINCSDRSPQPSWPIAPPNSCSRSGKLEFTLNALVKRLNIIRVMARRTKAAIVRA